MITRIGLCDYEFEHIRNPTCYTGFQVPETIEWDRTTPERNKIVCFTERAYNKSANHKFDNCIKIAWPLEPRSIHKYAYDDLFTTYKDNFEYVLCFDKNFSERFKNETKLKPIFWTPGGSYIKKQDWMIYPKNRNVQIIASKKDWTVGHRLRHEVIEKYKTKIDDIYGRAYNYYFYQLDPFKNHRFAIVIENDIIHDYWTDKLLDCFLTGTVPIVWNDGFITKYFNCDGMIIWKDIEDLKDILKICNENLYNKMLPAVNDNFNRALKYSIVEDFLYDNIKRTVFYE